MSSKEKNNKQQSILSFFSSDAKNGSNKRIHSEMLRGEIDTSIKSPVKKLKISEVEKVKINI